MVSSRPYRFRKNLNGLEALLHGYLIYTMLSLPFHINIPYLAAGWLFLLAFFSFFLAKWTKSGRLFLSLICLISAIHLFVQVFIHSVPLTAPYNEPFLFWPVFAVVMYALISKPGFIKRLAFVMFGIALVLQLFIVVRYQGDYARASLNGAGSGIDNANAYGAWLAFCCLVFWLWSWKESKLLQRLLMWSCALVAMLIAAQTVSRGALLALGAGMIFGIGWIPRKYWLGILFGLILLFIGLDQLPFFTMEKDYFVTRISEDTGRAELWELSWDAIQAQPWLGYGTDVLGGRNNTSMFGQINIFWTSPHNPFLLLWLGSGIFPIIPMAALWALAFFRSFRLGPASSPDSFALPLLVFSFIICMLDNVTVTSFWPAAILAYVYVARRSSTDHSQSVQMK